MIILVFAILFQYGLSNEIGRFQDTYVDRSNTEGVPKYENGGRVIEIFHAEHFDIILRDTPDEMRPPSIIAFYGYETCQAQFDLLNYRSNAETSLPSRERLVIGKYDMDAAPKRAWFEWVPERDLKKRMNVTACPTLVFVPPTCNGWTEWCEREVQETPAGKVSVMGCENFKEQCSGVKHWDGKGSWVQWAQGLISQTREPAISPWLGSYAAQEQWHRARDDCTTGEHLRMTFFPPNTPGFSERGFKAVATPAPLQEWLMTFFQKFQKAGRQKIEQWDAGLTQNSFHETQMFQVDLDLEYEMKTRMGDQYLKPMLEEWCGVKDLEVTSIYGVREYHEGHWLANHIDRESTHVISATFSMAKLPSPNASSPNEDSWPLEFVDFQGRTVRYKHPPGTVVFYESVKGIHGRPYRNPVEGGYHLGAFFHYRPPPSWRGDWKKVSQRINNAIPENSVRVAYRSSAVVEPSTPVFTARAYGEGAIPLGGKAADEDSGIGATFVNMHDEVLSLFWFNPDDSSGILQCKDVKPKKSCAINTQENHRFYWSAAPSKEDWMEFSTRLSDAEVQEDSWTVISAKKVRYVYYGPKTRKAAEKTEL